MGKNFVDLNVNNRFAEESELEQTYTEIDFNNADASEYNKAAGLCILPKYDIDGNVIGSLVDSGDTNTIIVSSTGAGKTRRVLLEYILSVALAGQNFIAHDPKGELFDFTKKLLDKKGYDVRVLNLRDPMRGDRLNMLERPARLYKEGKKGRALEIARGIAQSIYEAIQDKDDMFWTETSINLFLCYFIIAASIYEPEFVSLSTIYRVHIEGLEQKFGKTKMYHYLEKHRDELVYELGMPSITAPNETRQSIFSVFANGLSRIILNDEISDVLTCSTFEITDLASGKKPMALFIITRDESPQTYSTVVSAWIDMIYTMLIDEAQSRPEKRLPNSVHFILEEFGNIAKLANVNDYLTASRSRGIRMVLVLQSLAQLYLKYSSELAHVLIGNSQNLVYMSSTDMSLVKLISDRCGKMIDSYTKETRPLLGPDQLTHLNKGKGEALMLLDRHYPFIANLPDISKYKVLERSEVVDIPQREKLEIKSGLFANNVDELLEEKKNEVMNNIISGNNKYRFDVKHKDEENSSNDIVMKNEKDQDTVDLDAFFGTINEIIADSDDD